MTHPPPPPDELSCGGCSCCCCWAPLRLEVDLVQILEMVFLRKPLFWLSSKASSAMETSAE